MYMPSYVNIGVNDQTPEYSDWATFQQKELDKRKSGKGYSMYDSLFDTITNPMPVVNRFTRRLYDGSPEITDKMDGLLERMRTISDNQAQGQSPTYGDRGYIDQWEQLKKTGKVSGY